MPQLASLDDLRELRKRIKGDSVEEKPTVIVCADTTCQASESNRIIRSVKKHLLMNDLVDDVNLRVTGCLGFCEMGPILITAPQKAFYVKLHHYHIPRIIDALLDNKYVDELLYTDPATGKTYYDHDEIPFFAKQQRTLLSKNQEIDPIRFFNYVGAGGYLALEKVIDRADPDWVVSEVERSKLRGRGGAGFTTGTKWRLASKQDGKDGKFVVCNADEGDPGAYMDRSILEGNPHSVLEGMIIGGIAMGATEGFVFVRHEYPKAIKNTMIALRAAREYGILGKNILGSGIDFDISIVKSAGAFVCGEETALIKTIEGLMGEPKQRPPFPIERGIQGKPTCINNVETWANVPVVIQDGADQYMKIGTPDSTGTKVFSLVGKIQNTGLVEVPMGMSIGEMVYDIGGGPKDGGKLKAVQIGGPSGGCIPADRFDLHIDYDSLTEAGAIMGSGGMIVMDQDTCMVDVAKYFMNFLKDESCGKCFTCRKGTQRMWELLDDITRGEGSLEHLDLLEELAQTVKDTTMCGLGQSAANPVLSALRYFRDEFERHIVDRRCDAMVCTDLVGAPCQATCPIGTEAWRYVAHIAREEYEEAYLAIRESNPFPSVCARVCDHKCEARCRLGTSGMDPVAIRALKRFVTDRIEPSVFKPKRRSNGAAPASREDSVHPLDQQMIKAVVGEEPSHFSRSSEDREAIRVAVVGSGPAGLTAAHYLSLMNYKVTVFEADEKPGGMLVSGVPQYRLPREVLDKEIDVILDENVTLECNTTLGKDVTLDQLEEQGHRAVFLGLGAHRSRRLHVEGEDGAGVYPSMRFLKAWNLGGKNLASGKVGIIGGGNSAIDAARVALRQDGVESVTLLYRRTRDEMPAFEPEIQAALKEGIKLETLVSPTRILAESGKLTAVEFLKNELGDLDASGRRRPLPIEGSEIQVTLDTLVVAIGEQMRPLEDGGSSVDLTNWGTFLVDEDTLETSRPGVFAGGDAVTGPNTVVDAIAAGKKAAVMMDRHIRGETLKQPSEALIPRVHVEPAAAGDQAGVRADAPMISARERGGSFIEVEQSLSREDAVREARRCLRCDLEFTEREREEPLSSEAGGSR